MNEGDQLMVITDKGQLIRTRVDEISVYGRNTQGVRIMNIDEDEKIVSFARVREEDVAEEDVEVVEGEEGAEATAEQSETSDEVTDAPAEAADVVDADTTEEE